MKVLLVIAAFVAAASALQIPDSVIQQQFEDFKAEHGKTYASKAEELYRSKVFKENAIMIAKHNDRFAKGEVTYKVGFHKHADLHLHELIAVRNGFRPEAKKPSPMLHKSPNNFLASALVDWRTKGIVTDVKDQGQCGSCWTFSATGALEGQVAKKTGKLVALSEQNLVDCTKGWRYQMAGCNGGAMDAAFQYIADNKGIDTETSYPYTAKDGRRCKYSAKNIGGTDTGFVDVNPTEADLQHAIETVGPVSVAIDASLWSFNYYTSGVYYDSKCGNTQNDLDHGVLAVGFGSENNSDYWIVKNSWGESWGENGYIRMARNKNNACGLATMASYPTV